VSSDFTLASSTATARDGPALGAQVRRQAVAGAPMMRRIIENG